MRVLYVYVISFFDIWIPIGETDIYIEFNSGSIYKANWCLRNV